MWDTLVQGPDYCELRSLGYLADFRVVEPTVRLPENLPVDDMGEIDTRAAGAAVIELLRTDVVVNEWRAAVAPLVDRRTICGICRPSPQLHGSQRSCMRPTSRLRC